MTHGQYSRLWVKLLRDMRDFQKIGPCISIFSSARTPESDFFYNETVKLSEQISKKD